MVGDKVLVVGSANLDFVFTTDRLPAAGETVMGTSFECQPGGKGANQAVAIAKLGGQVAFLGCVGSDNFGNQLRENLAVLRVNTDHLRTTNDAPSGTACILVDRLGMNSIVVAPGANSCVEPSQVSLALADQSYSVVLSQLEIPMDAVFAASKTDQFILNPAPARPIPKEILVNCFALTPNESELQYLTGIVPVDDDSCMRAGKSLLDLGVKNVIITLGERGSYWVSQNGGKHFLAPSVSAIDSTGAGDAFSGALAWFLAQGRDLPKSISLANYVGALATTKVGAQNSMPTLPELMVLAKEVY